MNRFLIIMTLLVKGCSIPSITGFENLAGSSSVGKTDSNINCRSCVFSKKRLNI